MVRRIAVNFGMKTHFDCVKPSDGQKFELLKTTMAVFLAESF